MAASQVYGQKSLVGFGALIFANGILNLITQINFAAR